MQLAKNDNNPVLQFDWPTAARALRIGISFANVTTPLPNLESRSNTKNP
jgi:hypothetical protein